ncbi:hypothetical protein RvY_10376 [Ramazzottius varieornatus]|uniref:Peroxisomal biogenesis factor 3 n=1 Tax=Ramazzottius varieornatus TaxID=947166 RepID=A0A1D1VCK7_RAMVA|nr:hypothetical protein RvY_10376 [Ramazzottius varieornatus]
MFAKGYQFVKKHRRKAILFGAVGGGVYAYNNSETVKTVVDKSWAWLCHRVVDPVLGLPPTSLSQDEEDFVAASWSGEPEGKRGQENADSPASGIASNKNIVDTVIQLLEEQGLPLFDELLDIESLRQQIGRNPENKIELWEEMKIVAWSRCIASVYTICHLVTHIKVLTGVSARFLHEQPAASQEHFRNKLLLISKHIQSAEYAVGEGLQQLVKVVKVVVAKPISPRTLQEPLSLQDLKKIVYEVRKLMEAGSAMNGFVHARNYHLEFLIPEKHAEPMLESVADQQSFQLNELVLEALESVDCNLVLNCCLEKCFFRLFGELESVIKDRSPMYSEAPKVPLVALLPSIARTSQLFLKPPEALPVIEELVNLPYFTSFVDQIVLHSLQTDSLSG